MIEIQHDDSPSDLEDYARNHPGVTWGDFGREGSLKPRIRERLWQLQGGLCVYCERKLKADSSGSHIDHVKPKSKHPELTFHYHNMVCSCNGPKTCGHFKDDQALPIEPGPDCNKFFYLHTDGALCPRSGSAEEVQRARDTLDILGLNDASLQRDRKTYLQNVSTLVKQSDVETARAMVQTSPFRYVLKTLPFFKEG